MKKFVLFLIVAFCASFMLGAAAFTEPPEKSSFVKPSVLKDDKAIKVTAEAPSVTASYTSSTIPDRVTERIDNFKRPPLAETAFQFKTDKEIAGTSRKRRRREQQTFNDTTPPETTTAKSNPFDGTTSRQAFRGFSLVSFARATI